MATVELREGDVLNIVWTSVQNTPLGRKEVESSLSYTYAELMERLRSKTRRDTSRRSGTEGARFSRVVALATNAMHKGKWSTGADIDRDEVFQRMMSRFRELHTSEYQNITKNAKDSLSYLFQKKSLLKTLQKKELGTALTAIKDRDS
ncbi:MAG: hypothetical protein OYH77_04045 [Pseudomonadota bacterium]|nr:hypothetical protein [Pseudomonadota bacterium]